MNIIITGASRGIGEAISRNFANREGHNLFLIARSEASLAGLKMELDGLGKKNEIHSLNYDLSDIDSYPAIIKRVSAEVSSIDILINNAGSIVVKKFEDFTEEDIDMQFLVNYKAPVRLIKSFLPLLKKSNTPHVVNISSMSGFQGSKKFPGLSHYSASKAAISSLTEVLAEEFKGRICFNALCLGAVQTEMLEEAFPGYQAPLNPYEMAEFIADFSINAHKYFNGKVLPVSLSS